MDLTQILVILSAVKSFLDAWGIFYFIGAFLFIELVMAFIEKIRGGH